jgi:phospholipid transport system transporter-binding protein
MKKSDNQTIDLQRTEKGAIFHGVICFETANECCAIGTGYLQQTSLQCVCFDLSGIQKSNMAGLATMLCWLRVARSLGKQLTYQGVPEVVQNMAKICGVTKWIN